MLRHASRCCLGVPLRRRCSDLHCRLRLRTNFSIFVFCSDSPIFVFCSDSPIFVFCSDHSELLFAGGCLWGRALRSDQAVRAIRHAADFAYERYPRCGPGGRLQRRRQRGSGHAESKPQSNRQHQCLSRRGGRQFQPRSELSSWQCAIRLPGRRCAGRRQVRPFAGGNTHHERQWRWHVPACIIPAAARR